MSEQELDREIYEAMCNNIGVRVALAKLYYEFVRYVPKAAEREPVTAARETVEGRGTLDASCQAGWYLCTHQKKNLECCGYWDGKSLTVTSTPDSGEPEVLHKCSRFRGPLIPAADSRGDAVDPTKIPLELELPAGDERQVKCIWRQVVDGKLHLCLDIEGESSRVPAESEREVVYGDGKQHEFSRGVWLTFVAREKRKSPWIVETPDKFLTREDSAYVRLCDIPAPPPPPVPTWPKAPPKPELILWRIKISGLSFWSVEPMGGLPVTDPKTGNMFSLSEVERAEGGVDES